MKHCNNWKVRFVLSVVFFQWVLLSSAQMSAPKGLYKLAEIVHQDGKRLEAPFKQYKYCLDDLALMLTYNEPLLSNSSFDFVISNPDGKPLRLTGELSKTENKGIQVIGTSDSTFTLRWFNDRGSFNEHLFPSRTNIDEIYNLVADSSDNIRKALNVLEMRLGAKKHLIQGTWKLRGRQKYNVATSQYWIEQPEKELYQIFGVNGVVSVASNDRFPNASLYCNYVPCSYLSENVVEMNGQIYMVNWFDRETISITTLDKDGHPFVAVWDRCGLPCNIQTVFGTDIPQMKKDVVRFKLEDFEKRYGAQPDSVCKAFETFNFAVDANEQNNAIFPILMKCGFRNEYNAMKDSLLAKLMGGGITVDEAVGRYVFWFYYNFDRHTNCTSSFFRKLQSEVMTDYSKLIQQYAPEPVACKVDDETYLLRLPSCMGVVPTWEWMKTKETEFRQSGCKYLILDLRGNDGGSDLYSMLFADMMLGGCTLNDMRFLYMNSMENNKLLRTYGGRDKVLAEADTAAEGSLISWMTFPKGTGEKKPFVRRGAIIIDNYTASAGESPVRWARNYSKACAVVYGRERSSGCDLSGNCNDIRLPHTNITLRFPMTVDEEFEKKCKEKSPGHKPDVIIPLPYPEKLTDNVDSWVLWVAKDMKKRRN